jgi:hypothetical protein
MVLIEFLFAGKNIEDQGFRFSDKHGCHRSFGAIVVFVLSVTPTRDFV